MKRWSLSFFCCCSSLMLAAGPRWLLSSSRLISLWNFSLAAVSIAWMRVKGRLRVARLRTAMRLLSPVNCSIGVLGKVQVAVHRP